MLDEACRHGEMMVRCFCVTTLVALLKSFISEMRSAECVRCLFPDTCNIHEDNLTSNIACTIPASLQHVVVVALDEYMLGKERKKGNDDIYVLELIYVG